MSVVRGITKTYGTGYYRATLLFPKALKEATWTLYAFVRLPDEMIDTETDKTVSAQQLAQWTEQWKRVYQGESVPGVNEILLQTKHVFDQYKIPFEYSEAFLTAMTQDLSQSRYAKYEDLRGYMYGSAAVVGLMMSHVIGFNDGALSHAVALGEAMQMTNFLRDIREDYDTRGRIYLPQEDLARFGITEQDIATHTVSEKWKELMRFEIARTRALFREGNAGILLLHKDGRRAVTAASRVYEAILDEIEKQQYDVFTRRAKVSPLKKTLLIVQTLWKRNQS